MRQIKTSLLQKIALLLLGVVLFGVALELSLRIAGFTYLALQEERNKISMRKNSEFRIMCLGESTTSGQYPGFLEEILNKRAGGARFSVIDKGVPGTNTAAIVASIGANLDKYRPDVVVTMMGINDHAAHLPYEAPSGSKISNFIKSLKTYKLARLIWLHAKVKSAAAQKEEGIPADTAIAPAMAAEIEAKEADLLDSEERLKKAVEANPENYVGYLNLGMHYNITGNFTKAIEMFNKAVELNQNCDGGYAALGWSNQSLGRYNDASAFFAKALAMNPGNRWAWMGLGSSYISLGKYQLAEEPFKKTIELDPKDEWGYLRLGESYEKQGKFKQAEDLFKKVIAMQPDNDWAYGALSTLYQLSGNPVKAKEYYLKANETRIQYFPPFTVTNYLKLKKILDERRIRLVCVQYPVRNVASLKKIFEGQKGVVFVDNEKIFKSAINKEGYSVYFIDIFGGDFGHCTNKGNKLLASNIAKAILKEVFRK